MENVFQYYFTDDYLGHKIHLQRDRESETEIQFASLVGNVMLKEMPIAHINKI